MKKSKKFPVFKTGGYVPDKAFSDAVGKLMLNNFEPILKYAMSGQYYPGKVWVEEKERKPKEITKPKQGRIKRVVTKEIKEDK